MGTFMEFQEFQKIPRLSRGIVVTEKIDGTNAQVAIDDDGDMHFGSRNRWITPDDDNCGFARWAAENRGELSKLGAGRHYGEWWGAGIQRRYGLTEKRFSLFNTGRWADASLLPACVHVVPILYQGDFSQEAITAALESLRTNGSVAAPGFMRPEGIVIYHAAARMLFKKTIEKDDMPKGIAA